jgi:hypothetical protein
MAAPMSPHLLHRQYDHREYFSHLYWGKELVTAATNQHDGAIAYILKSEPLWERHIREAFVKTAELCNTWILLLFLNKEWVLQGLIKEEALLYTRPDSLSDAVIASHFSLAVIKTIVRSSKVKDLQGSSQDFPLFRALLQEVSHNGQSTLMDCLVEEKMLESLLRYSPQWQDRESSTCRVQTLYDAALKTNNVRAIQVLKPYLTHPGQLLPADKKV